MDRGDNVTPGRAAVKGSGAADVRGASLAISDDVRTFGSSAPLGTLERGLHLLGLFTAEKPAWTLRELREESELPKATVRRIVLTLERYGWLAAEGRSGAYGLGPMVLQGLFARRSAGLVADLARPHLEELARRTTESALLTIWGHSGALTVDMVTTERHFKPFTSVGMVIEGLDTADAQVLNAFASPETQQARLATLLPQDALDAPRLEATRASWAEVRRTGVAFDRQQWRQGVCAVAAPVLDASGEAVASISVVLPSERGGEDDLLSHADDARDAGDAISAMLQGRTLRMFG